MLVCSATVGQYALAICGKIQLQAGRLVGFNFNACGMVLKFLIIIHFC